MPYSLPLRVSIPAIGVRAPVVPLGLNRDGTVAVPPLSEPMETSWYDLGPAPGEQGPAVLYGHVDTARTGPAVFYKLGDLQPGDLVQVARADHQTAVFSVDWVGMYAKVRFPTALVYGQTPDAELRLVTCGGDFNPTTGSYLDNVIVFAHLTAVQNP